ncbi:MAG: 30S ribosomal protein S2 [Candidatus Omnitrophica bacterium]|nr:30S ribosomal protein S2 [Candidatus Omnitrophota bacterium]MBU0878225.1 30S ribosomal protein S2 [Candidatus Omnitrophota bacterium]MBU1133441.1 30S ribosomal protein S2 [Candidatus Omnitrophota bacterium]MBU1366711.1 30S ribosomal protein S2 [Candidatus Omnitrophota bacterium]MBU1810788.1 30S ribosomal protein S2 [Candidatus Omnitrophota bacterium]
MALPEVIKELLENGVHFGHLSKYWNPKMARFIFGKKKNIYIIDLEKTAEELQVAKEFVRKMAQDGKKILFVATKRQSRNLIKELAIECNMPYIVERWVGGLLTNFSTVRPRVKRYAELLKEKELGELDKMSGKEAVRVNRQIKRMERKYRGVIFLEELPDCMYIVDPKREIACVREANKLSIPIVALIDTDANPEIIDYPIPGNDDAIKSVRYITTCVVEAINQGVKESEALVAELGKQDEQIKEEPESLEGKKSKIEIENVEEEKV